MNNILTILAHDKNIKLYRPELNQITGNVIATLLLQQMIYWGINKNGTAKEFYKFKEPCEHELYQPGDSWCEELGFTAEQFETAIKKIGFKKIKGYKKGNILKGQTAKSPEEALITYYTDSSRITRYTVNHGLLEQRLNTVYFSIIQKTTHIYKKNIKKPFKKEVENPKETVPSEPMPIELTGFLKQKTINKAKRSLKKKHGGYMPPWADLNKEVENNKKETKRVMLTNASPQSNEFVNFLKWLKTIGKPTTYHPETEENWNRVRKTFEKAEIKAAVKIALLDEFWEQHFNFNTFIRPNNYNGDPQDNIATFYQKKAGNNLKIFTIKQDMKHELQK